ncbi:MAG: hypothetical protein O2950_05880 [Proteobacteria bacterium]|nr:hypothetical protein [Pseudomonadota bacterium]
MSTDYFPDREVKMSEFFNKKEELKSHGITVEEIDKQYRLKLDVPDNVSSFDIFKECQNHRYVKLFKKLKKKFGIELSTKELIDFLDDIYKQEVRDKGFGDCYEWVGSESCQKLNETKLPKGNGKTISRDDLLNLIFSLNVPFDSKHKSNYMWLHNGHRNKDIIGGVCRYGCNTDTYLVKILEKVLGFKLIDEHTYMENDMEKVS